jgi:integrase
MRLKDYPERDGKRVWLSEREIGILMDSVDSGHPQMSLAFELGVRCGLRRAEIVAVTPVDLKSNSTGDIIRVWDGKGDKYREVPATPEITGIARGLGKEPDEPLVDVYASTVYDWTKRARERARAKTGDEGWQFLGPHDLRRTWGVRLLEAGVLPSVVMSWGGWDDWITFRDSYLSELSPEALRRERGKVGWLSERRQDPDDDTRSKQGYSSVNRESRY